MALEGWAFKEASRSLFMRDQATEGYCFRRVV